MGNLDDMFKGGGGFFDQMTSQVMRGMDEATGNAMVDSANAQAAQELAPTTTMAEAQELMQDQAVIDHQREVDTLSATDNPPEPSLAAQAPEPPPMEAGE